MKNATKAVSGGSVVSFAVRADYWTTQKPFKLSAMSIMALALLAGAALMPATAQGDIFVTNYNGTVGEYTTSGATVNASLVSGLYEPMGIAVSGSNLFVANYSSGTIGEYDAITGATVNASLVSGLSYPYGIAVTPEPATLSVLALGGLAILRRRRSSRVAPVS